MIELTAVMGVTLLRSTALMEYIVSRCIVLLENIRIENNGLTNPPNDTLPRQ